jgi:hypothetical protein
MMRHMMNNDAHTCGESAREAAMKALREESPEDTDAAAFTGAEEHCVYFGAYKPVKKRQAVCYNVEDFVAVLTDSDKPDAPTPFSLAHILAINGSKVQVRWYHQEKKNPNPGKAFYASLNHAGMKYQQTIECSNILDVALEFLSNKSTRSKRLTAKSMKMVLAAVAAYHAEHSS